MYVPFHFCFLQMRKVHHYLRYILNITTKNTISSATPLRVYLVTCYTPSYPTSFKMAAERVDSFAKLNLSAIKKCDQFVVNIVDNASQVALYKFNGEKQAWVCKTRLIK